MYVYENAVVRLKYSKRHFTEMDIRNEQIRDVFASYSEIYLTLSNTLTDQIYYVYLEDCRTELELLLDTITIDTWLSVRGNTTLPTVPSIPTIRAAHVRYRDVLAAGFTAEVSHPSGTLTGPIDDPDYTDILINRANLTDIQHFADHTLYTVNGLIHRGVATANGVLIKNGAKSIRRALQTQLGLISFLDVGALSFYHLKPDDVFNPHQGGKLIDETWLQINEPIGDRVPMVVMGGYLLPLGGQVDVVGVDTIRVRPYEAGYVDKWLQSHRMMDMSSVAVHMPVDPLNPSAFNKEALLGDDVLRAYFTSDQSFVVLVDVDNLHVDVRKLEYTGLNGRYYDNTITDDVLITTNGLIREYLSFPDHGKWVVAVDTNESPAPMYHTTSDASVQVLDTKRESWWPYDYAPAHMWHIWTELTP